MIARQLARYGPLPTGEIVEHFKNRAGKVTMLKRIAQAEAMGLIVRPSREAPWRLCDSEPVH